jgi:hypothetical protein
VQAISSFKEDGIKILLFAFVNDKLNTKLIEMVLNNITGVGVGLGQESCFDKSFGMGRRVNNGIHVQEGGAVGGQVLRVFGKSCTLNLC